MTSLQTIWIDQGYDATINTGAGSITTISVATFADLYATDLIS
jgi:hypothetical protein